MCMGTQKKLFSRPWEDWRTPAEFGPHRDWKWNWKAVWNPGWFQGWGPREHMGLDSGTPPFPWLISSLWLVLWFLLTDFFNLCPLYFLELQVSDPHDDFILFVMQLSPSGFLLGHGLLSSASNCFTLLLFFFWIIKRKSLVGPGLVLWQYLVTSAGLGTVIHNWLFSGAISWEGWGRFHMIPHVLPKVSLLRQPVYQFLLGESHDFAVEDITLKKSHFYSAPRIVVNKIMLLYTCHIPVFFT